jgi:hypothetical protein
MAMAPSLLSDAEHAEATDLFQVLVAACSGKSPIMISQAVLNLLVTIGRSMELKRATNTPPVILAEMVAQWAVSLEAADGMIFRSRLKELLEATQITWEKSDAIATN